MIPTKTQPRPTDAYDLEVEAERELSALLAEQAAIPNDVAEASQVPDPVRIVALRRRADELPSFIFAARAKVLRLQVDRLKSQADAMAAQVPAADKRWQETFRALEAARAAHADATASVEQLRNGVTQATRDIQAKERELADLLAEESRDRGPVVRAANLAGRGLRNA